MRSKFVTKTQLAEEIGLSSHTFRRYRERGEWQQDVHYVKLRQNVVLYNLNLCLDWVANRNNPVAHQRAIRQYLQSLSNEETTTATRQKGQRQHKAKG
jgi:phage terminase Nu1 subunit (DNA packaging protein)